MPPYTMMSLSIIYVGHGFIASLAKGRSAEAQWVESLILNG